MRIEVDRLDQADLRRLHRPGVGHRRGGRIVGPRRGRNALDHVRGAGIAGADQGAAERQIADAIGRVETLVADPRARVRQEIADEARVRPGRAQAPARVPRLRGEAERGIAAEVIGEIDRDGRGREHRGVEPGEESSPAAASAARLEPQRPALGRDLRVGAESARVAEAEAQLRARKVHLRELDSGPREVGRKGEVRAAGDLRLVDDCLVDRPLAPLGLDVGGELDRFGSQRQLAHHVAAAGDALAVLDDGLRRHCAIGDDEHRPGHRLRSAPAGGDRRARLVRLGLTVVDQQPDREERNGQDEADDDRQRKLEAGGPLAIDSQHDLVSRRRLAR